ncbi:MAG: creatininase family protein [bacterium]
MAKKVRYEELFPQEMEAIVKGTPIVYLPFGTLEWHGLHLALGNDAVKAHEICLRVAERAGGIVAPPTFWAIGGMPHPWTTRLDMDLIERLFYAIFQQMDHVGFDVMIAVTGHYGLEQYYTLKKAARDFMYKSGAIVYPIPEYEVTFDEGYRGDHAAKWETSILWALRPDLVDLGRLSKNLDEPLEGVGGEDPRTQASRELGERIVGIIVERLSEVANRLLRETSPLHRAKFLEALDKQVGILERLLEVGREERHRVLGSEEYYRFVDLFWRGDYRGAELAADGILASMPK